MRFDIPLNKETKPNLTWGGVWNKLWPSHLKDFATKLEILKLADLSSVKDVLIQKKVWWLGHIEGWRTEDYPDKSNFHNCPKEKGTKVDPG